MALTFNLNEIDWINKQKRQSDCDVTISIIKAGERRKALNIIFRNDTHKFFKTGYIQVAILGDILLMKESEQGIGYKITQSAPYTSRVTISGNEDLNEWGKNHIGDYVFYKDIKQEVAYIERERKF